MPVGYLNLGSRLLLGSLLSTAVAVLNPTLDGKDPQTQQHGSLPHEPSSPITTALDYTPVFQVGSGAVGDAPAMKGHLRVNSGLTQESVRFDESSVRTAAPNEPNTEPPLPNSLQNKTEKPAIWQIGLSLPRMVLFLAILWLVCCMMPGSGGGGQPGNLVGRNDFTTKLPPGWNPEHDATRG